MMELRAALGADLFHHLETLRSEKGNITAEDAGGIIAQMMRSGSGALHKEIALMIADIQTAKKEISALSSGAQTNKQAISDASAHLDTVIQSTEEATICFIDAAGAIDQLAEEIGGTRGARLQQVSTRIYEACNFQDLTSQRIVKAIKLIRAMEEHIVNLMRCFDMAETTPVNAPEGDAALLNGPALPRDAVSQDEIDALFKSLGG